MILEVELQVKVHSTLHLAIGKNRNIFCEMNWFVEANMWQLWCKHWYGIIDRFTWVLFIVHISTFKSAFSQLITVACMISVL